MVNYAKKYDVVADLYDTYVSSAEDIPFWIQEASREKEVLELTAGTGRVTLALARAGIKVTAVDVSAPMLKILRKKARNEGLQITTRRADVRDFNLGKRFALIIIPFNSIQEFITLKDVRAVFEQVRKHLRGDGRFIITIHNTEPSKEGNQGIKSRVREYVDERNGHKILYSSRRQVNRRTHTGVSYQAYEEYDGKGKFLGKRLFKNRYHVFAKGELERIAKTEGFRIQNVFGDYSRSIVSEDSPLRIYELIAK